MNFEKTFQRCVRCGEIFGTKQEISGENLDRVAKHILKFSPSLRQSLPRLYPVEISLRRALRQRAFQGGVIEEKVLRGDA